MDGSDREFATHVMQVRASRWWIAAVAFLLLAACARWPLAGVPLADASPPPGAGSAPRDEASASRVAIHGDGSRTPQPSLRAHRASAWTGVPRHVSDVRSTIGSAREDNPAEADADAIGQGVRGMQEATQGVAEPAAPAPPDSVLQPGAAMRRGVESAERTAIVASPGAAVEVSHLRTVWFTGIAATLLALFVIGWRKRNRRRVMKMDTQRAEPLALPTTPTIETSRVRMFSALEMYAPTHETHHGRWEAPVKTERGFAHRYVMGAQVGGLLFVPESGADHVDAHPTDPPGPEAVGTAWPAVVPAARPAVTRPAAAPPAPLVFSAAATGAGMMTMAESTVDEHPSHAAARELEPPVSAVLTAAAADIVAIQPDTGVARISSALVATATVPAAGTNPKLPSPKVTATPARTGLLDASELFRQTPRATVGGAGPAPAPALAQTPARQPIAPTRDPIDEARRLVEAGDHAAALRHLDEAMQSQDHSEDASRLAALCWWQIGRAGGGAKAYANAADAMERLLERDPSQTELWYRTGSCRLLQAADERGVTRRATLDQAVAALRHAVPEGGRGDPLQVATLADALFERAVTTTDGAPLARAQRMAQAVQVLREAARGARDRSSVPAWKLQQALQAQASFLSGTEASRLRMEAEGVLAAGIDSADEQARVLWIAARAENELAHAELAEGATRILHLRTFRENNREVMTGPDAAPELLLGWLELLALETGHLRGDAARSRFDEGEAILKRLDEMLPGNTHVALARARLLHRRAMQSGVGSGHAVLSDAIAGLMPLVERGNAPQAQIEVAELLLDRAAGAPQTQAAEDHARAEAMASGLIEDRVFAMAAARCVLQARLGQSSGAVEPAVCRRLEMLADEDVRSRWLLARAALRNGSAREACGHCEIAARSGARLDQAFIQLWDQASRQWGATLHDPKDPAWLANRQRLRSAS